MKKEMNRRQFIQKTTTGLAVGAALTTLGCATKVAASGMPMRTLGKTGLDVSVLSFGGGSQFLKNKDGEWEKMLERAVELGVNYFDTASQYKWGAKLSSEQKFGEVLSSYRDKIIISTKFDARTPDEAMVEIEQSLKDMKTDYIDILMMHSIEPSEDIAAFENGMYKKMMELKEQGVARHIGFSSMNSCEKSKELVDAVDVDACILAINPTKYGRFADITLPSTREKNVGVVAMKVMRDVVGTEATPKELLEYALLQNGVATAVIGHHGIDKLEQNVELVKEIVKEATASVNQNELENRLAHLAGPHALCWARPDYYDGKMC